MLHLTRGQFPMNRVFVKAFKGKAARYVLLVFLFSLTHWGQVHVAQETLELNNQQAIARAMVLIEIDKGNTTTFASGMIVSSAGFIFTPYEVVASPAGAIDTIHISTFSGFDSAPIQAYQASLVFEDEMLNLAVLQIDRDLNGSPIFSDALRLDYIYTWGRDLETVVGDRVFTFAYQQVEGETDLTTGSGTVVVRSSSSTPSDRSEVEDYLDSTYVGDSNRGGAVVNANGEVVGFVAGLEQNTSGSSDSTANLTRFVPLYVICSVHQRLCDGLFETTPPLTQATLQAAVCLRRDITLDLRAEPSTNSRSLERVGLGDQVSIINTPSVSGEDFSWVLVQTASGNRGWLPDVFNQSRTILSYSSEIQSAENYTVQIGGRALICATYPHEEMDLWSRPNGQVDGQLRSGVIVTIIGGPVVRENGDWWQVIDTNGVSGWMVDSEDGSRSLIGLP